MANNSPRGSINLGLIKAIHSGINPPLNTKIIWYDDNLGQKIHKYYDVGTSQWIPLSGTGGVVVGGIFTYLAYASDCDGSNFSLSYDESIHNNISIITSSTEIDSNSLIPGLFSGKWIQFCRSKEDGGNFTYVRYADNCDGDNFSDSPFYEEPKDPCKLVDSFNVITASTDVNNFNVSISGDKILLNLIKSLNPFTIEIELKMSNELLVNSIDYYIELEVTNNLKSKFFVRLDGNETGGYNVIPNGQIQNFKFTKRNYGSRIYLEFLDGNTEELNTEIYFKVGSLSCSSDVPDIIRKCRCCIGVLTSDIKLSEQDLTSDKFKDIWFCKCPGDNYNSDVSNLQQLVYSLIGKISDTEESLLSKITAIELLYTDLQNELNSQVQTLRNEFNTTFDELNLSINQLFSYYQDLLTSYNSLNLRVNNTENQLSDTVFVPRVMNIVSGSVMSTKDILINILNNSKLEINWKNGAIKFSKTRNENTSGVQNNIYSRNGFIGNGEIYLDSFGSIRYRLKDDSEENKFYEIKNIQNIISKIDKYSWDLLSSYSEITLYIKRYKQSKKVRKETGNVNKNANTTSGFKLSKKELLFKPNKIQLNKHYQVLDIGQEHYFKLNKDLNSFGDVFTIGENVEGIVARGLKNRFDTRYRSNFKNENEGSFFITSKSWIYLEFGLMINYNGEELYSVPLDRIKMELKITDGIENTVVKTIENKITFKKS